MKETVSDEAREDQWGVRSIDKVQHTEKKQLTIRCKNVFIFLFLQVSK